MTITASDALDCDFAEYYHIYDRQSLPLRYAATLAVGLSNDSRTKRTISGMPAPMDIVIAAYIADRLAQLLWIKTINARTGRNKPLLFTDILFDRKSKESDRNELSFASADDFEAARNELLRQVETNG